MGKAPAFQFYPAEFLADENVRLMTNEQKGVYIVLISTCWLEGSIPVSLDDLSILGNCSKDILPRVVKCFFSDPKNSERLLHPRLEKERAKQKKFSKHQSDRAKTGWQKAKSGYADGIPTACPTDAEPACSSSLSSSSSSDEIKATKKPTKKKTIVSDDWQPDESFHTWLRENRPDISQAEKDFQIAKFRDYGRATGKAYIDHTAALRNWFQSPYFKPGTTPEPPRPGTRLHGNGIVPAEQRTGGVIEL